MMNNSNSFNTRKNGRQKKNNIDAFDNHQKPISESNSSDHITVKNGNNYRLPQSISTKTNSKNVNKQTKTTNTTVEENSGIYQVSSRIQSFRKTGPNVYHAQEHHRNTSKVFLNSGQKRSHSTVTLFSDLADKSNVDSIDSVVSISSTSTSNHKEIQTAITSNLSVISCVSVSNTTLTTTPSAQSTLPTFDCQPSESTSKKQSTPLMQLYKSKINGKQTIPSALFRTTKESENTDTTQLSIKNNQKSNEKPTKPIQIQRFPSKSDDISSVAVSKTESKNTCFESNNLQNQNVCSFGKIVMPTPPIANLSKNDTTSKNLTVKLSVGTTPTSAFGITNVNQSNDLISTSVSESDNQCHKLVPDNQIIENNLTSAPTSDLPLANNILNSVFQCNDCNSNLKPNGKVSEVSSNLFPHPSTKTTSAFQDSASQCSSNNKPAYHQYNNAKQTEETKSQSTPKFRSQNTTTIPHKLEANNDSASFGNSTLPSSNQPMQCTNNTKKTADQTSNGFLYSMPEFRDSRSSILQQIITLSNITPASQPLLFDNAAVMPMSNSLVMNQDLQFGNFPPPSSQPLPFDIVTVTPMFNSFEINQSFQFENSNNALNSSSFIFGDNLQPTMPNSTFSYTVHPTITTIPLFQFNQTPSTVILMPPFGDPSTQDETLNFGLSPMLQNNVVYVYLFNAPMIPPNQPLISYPYYTHF